MIPPLVPKFSLEEPNMRSARKKNNEGLCAFHDCRNKMDLESWFFGFNVCKNCLEKYGFTLEI